MVLQLKLQYKNIIHQKGVCIQGTGITPDYEIELPEQYLYVNTIPEEEDTQLQKALDVVKQEMK